MAWKTFHTKVKVTAGGVDYTLPVDALTISAEPYSGTGDIAVELFDGRRVQRIDGWRYTVEFSWRELKETDHASLLTAIKQIAANGEGIIDFDPVDDPSTKVLTVILSDAAQALRSIFNGMVRSRGAAVTLVSTNVDTVPQTWITE